MQHPKKINGNDIEYKCTLHPTPLPFKRRPHYADTKKKTSWNNIPRRLCRMRFLYTIIYFMSIKNLHIFKSLEGKLKYGRFSAIIQPDTYCTVLPAADGTV